MRSAAILGLCLAACTTPPPGLMADADLSERARDALAVTPVVPAPSCAVAIDCPDLGVPYERCVEDPTLFEVSVFGDRVVEVTVVPERLAELSLAPGTWYTAFADPTGGCDANAFAFAGAPGGL